MNSITNRQMVMLLIMTLTCYSIIVIPKDMAKSAGTGSWLTLLVAALIFGLAAVIIVSLNSLFPGRMFYDYAPQLVGRPVAMIIIFFYIIYFMFILVYLITAKAKLLSGEFFINTPQWSFPLVGIPVFCYIANKGIRNVGRLSEIIGIVFIVVAVGIHTIMITQGRLNRILPLFNAAEMKDYALGLKSAVFSFLGIEVLLAIPLTKINKNSKRTAFFSLLFIGLIYILIVESCIMKVGLHDIVNYDDPLILAVRDTAPEYMEVFTRLDILYLTIGFSALFVGIAIVMTVITEFLCKLFKKIKRPIIVSALGILTYIAFYIVKDIKHYDEFVNAAGTYTGIFTAILIPSLFLVIAKVKRKKVKGKKDAA